MRPIKVHSKDVGLKFPRNIGKDTKKTKADVPEDTIQSFVEQYLDALHIPYLRIPAVVYAVVFGRKSRSGAELNALRDAKEKIGGFPDLLIMKDGRYLPLELKTEIGKLNTAQKRWKYAIGTLVPRSFESARKIIDEFLSCE